MVDKMKILNSKTCCYCLPLRTSLLCIGYLRLTICILTIVQFTVTSVAMFNGMQDSYEDAVIFLKSIASIVPHLLDLIFSMTFIVALHKKSAKLSEVYYFYCITMVLVYSLVVVLICCDWRRFNILYHMMFQYAWYIDCGLYAFIGLGVFVILLQAYMTLLVRSEVLHLKETIKAKLAKQRSSISFRLPQLNKMK